MRQLGCAPFNAVAGGGIMPIMTTIVPAGSWGEGKILMIRGYYTIVLPSPVPPGTGEVWDYITTSQTDPCILNDGLLPDGVSGGQVNWIERCVIRIGGALAMLDRGQCLQFTFGSEWDGLEDVQLIAATVPPLDFSVAITVSLAMKLDASLTLAAATTQYCEAFLEQGTNLGTLS